MHVKPVYHRQICEGHLEIAVYGACRNWRFAGGTAQEMDEANPGIVNALQKVITRHRIERALVPRPVFGTDIVNRVQLTQMLFPRFYRGAQADGVRLNFTNDAYLLSSADCPCVVICDPRKAIALAMHAGRDALIDRDLIAGKPARAQFSVIDRAMDLMRNRGWVKGSPLYVFIAAGIGPIGFTHPTTPTFWGEDNQEYVNDRHASNRELITYLKQTYDRFHFNIVTDDDRGSIDLVELIIAQLSEYGVTREQIEWDGVDTAFDQDENNQFLFHSWRRDPETRNLVMVKLH